jgi:uroporphyrinogen-III synthase
MNGPKPLLLAIRPPDRWERTRTAFATLAIDLDCTDTLTYSPIAVDPIDVHGDIGLIISSQRAIESLSPEHYDILRPLPMAVVGAETARWLLSRGFEGPTIVAPTAQALIPMIKSSGRTQWIYIRGDEVSTDFALTLGKKFRVQPVITYTSTARTEFDPLTLEKLRQNAYRGIMFFSSASARAFTELVDKSGLAPTLKPLTALCLSANVLASIQSSSWQQCLAATTPDLVGMVALTQSWLYPRLEDSMQPTPISTDTILDADLIIEKFGGIRPMATKIGVPVTTVQGWKKRGVIPANRAQLIEAAAASHGVELTGLIRIVSGEAVTHIQLPKAPATPATSIAETPRHSAPSLDQASIAELMSQLTQELNKGDEPTPVAAASSQASTSTADTPAAPMTTKPQRRKIDPTVRTAWLAATVLALAVLVGLLAMRPGVATIKAQETQLTTLETELQTLKDQLARVRAQNTLLAGLVPQNLQSELGALRERAQTLEGAITSLGTQTKALTEGVMGSATGTIENRLTAVEGHLTKLTTLNGPEALQNFITRIKTWQATPDGQGTVARALAALQTHVQTLGVSAATTFDGPLPATITNDPAWAQTFGDLRGAELKAGALLLSLGQLRAHIAQGDAPLQAELAILTNLLGPTNTELTQAITALQPWANTGVMNTSGLQTAFEPARQAAIAATLESGQLSWLDQAQAKLHGLVQIERGGQALIGTPTQRTLDVAARQVATGDLAAALVTLQGLGSPAAAHMADWARQAEGTLAARKVQDIMTRMISSEISLAPFMQQLSTQPQNLVNPQALTQGIIDSLAVGVDR